MRPTNRAATAASPTYTHPPIQVGTRHLPDVGRRVRPQVVGHRVDRAALLLRRLVGEILEILPFHVGGRAGVLGQFGQKHGGLGGDADGVVDIGESDGQVGQCEGVHRVGDHIAGRLARAGGAGDEEVTTRLVAGPGESPQPQDVGGLGLESGKQCMNLNSSIERVGKSRSDC